VLIDLTRLSPWQLRRGIGCDKKVHSSLGLNMTMHAEVEKNSRSTDSSQKEWRRPVLRKLPIAATANKISGNEGQGQGKGDNIGFIS
jgi:hypothetical protein